jgi:DNA repair protein RadC
MTVAPRLTLHVAGARDVLLAGQAETLSDAGLLSVLIGAPSSERATALLAEHPIPDGLWRVCAEDLVALDGVGPAGAARVLACLEMSRRASVWRCGRRPTISTPEDVVELCAPQLRGLDREHFWLLALNTKNQLLKMVEVSVGSLSASIVHPRELFREAVKLSAASVVVMHNHPSGDPTPSGADIQLTRRLTKAGDVLGIELLDHVVIGDGGEHASLRDLGMM